ncbi:hypothetical protein G7Y89_g7897 [Cudoniella acicularis]|uniref:RNI-like protein n=1 Tax=Cudoniella acicularis TaxID=354080 RepID=A0A8H4RK41_9HELO|nr:hypothetical protein G7Y89_g7897 [Cudoniella acicularis]
MSRPSSAHSPYPQPRPNRQFLSPLDALEMRSSARVGVKRSNRESPSPDTASAGIFAGSSSSLHSQILLPLVSATKAPAPSTHHSSSKDFWSVDSLGEQFGAGTPQQKQVKAAATTRRFSDQDIKTRSARASLPLAHKHKKSAASYPIYSPNSQTVLSGFSPTPPFLPFGLQDMDPRLNSRPGSSSSISTKSSFGSRHKSPLSISSSVDYDSRATSQESLLSSNTSIDDLRVHDQAGGIWSLKEPIIPAFARTLRSRPDLAEYVKSLKVPAMPDTAKTQKEQDGYMDLVASVIMACPNLERLPGFYPSYNHEYSRFVHALSSRKKLQERVWMISRSPLQRTYRYNVTENSDFLAPVLVPNFLLPEQCVEFLSFHTNWTHLQTLVMHCNPDGTMNSSLFTDIFKYLPSLENLHLSSFPATDFNDTTLLSLPSLKSLRLENLAGLTDHGLSNFASPARTDRLKSLTLISLSMLSLPVLARLFSHLKSLTHFKISQGPSPSLPIGTEIFLHPYLASSTLENIHWEFTNANDEKATDILSKSIAFSGFPALKTIRAPTDFQGALQKLCKPRDRIELPGDKYRNIGLQPHNGIPSSQSMPSLPSPTRSTFSLGHGRAGSVNSNIGKSPTRSAFSLNIESTSTKNNEPASHEKGMGLSMARRLAQQRIDAATQKPQFHIIIWDEDGQFLERHAVGGFIGQVQSKISYVLKPDLDGSDESFMGVEALLDGTEETNIAICLNHNLLPIQPILAVALLQHIVPPNRGQPSSNKMFPPTLSKMLFAMLLCMSVLLAFPQTASCTQPGPEPNSQTQRPLHQDSSTRQPTQAIFNLLTLERELTTQMSTHNNIMTAHLACLTTLLTSISSNLSNDITSLSNLENLLATTSNPNLYTVFIAQLQVAKGREVQSSIKEALRILEMMRKENEAFEAWMREFRERVREWKFDVRGMAGGKKEYFSYSPAEGEKEESASKTQKLRGGLTTVRPTNQYRSKKM